MDSPAALTGPVNLGNPTEFTIRELAETVIVLTSSKSKLSYHPLPSDDPRQRRPDITLATRSFNWQPLIKLEEGLKETIQFFRESL
jgi:UDP-glucuronate decarboxylase